MTRLQPLPVVARRPARHGPGRPPPLLHAAIIAIAAAIVGAAAAPDAGAEAADELTHASVGPFEIGWESFWRGWADDDPVEVFYSEFLLAQWVLDHSPWNAYHSGLGFVNNRTGTRAMFDFAPADTSSVMKIVIPGIDYRRIWEAFLGEFEIVWSNAAVTNFYQYWPNNFKSFVRLGQLNGAIMRRFAEWVKNEWEPRYKTFNPLEIVVPNVGVAVRSRMCHDFVTDSLSVLYAEGAVLGAEEPIFRDHILIYAYSVRLASEEPRLPRQRRWMRYLRLLHMYMESIKAQFTHGRTAFLVGWKLGLPGYWNALDNDYRVHLAPPFLNYCYLPLAIPPKTYDPFSRNKLCALGLEANLTNTTAPLPWGPMLAAEAHLDSPETALAIAIVALAAVFGQRRSSLAAKAAAA